MIIRYFFLLVCEKKNEINNKQVINNKQKREDNRPSQKIDHNERFQEKKLDFKNEKTGMDFDNLIESEYPKTYISKFDSDISNILSINNIDMADSKKNISFDNFKLLLELMKNKKAALFENNFYMDEEYSTDIEKIKGNSNNFKGSLSNIDYLELFKSLLNSNNKQ
jgi:hypothetical protein